MRIGMRYDIKVLADGTQVRTETPVEEDDAEVKAGAKLALRGSIWDFLDEHLDPREREALSALLQKVTVMRGMGLSVNEWAALALISTLQWAEDALALYPALAAKIDEARTYDEVQAVAFNPEALGPPPKVSASELALLLRAPQ